MISNIQNKVIAERNTTATRTLVSGFFLKPLLRFLHDLAEWGRTLANPLTRRWRAGHDVFIYVQKAATVLPFPYRSVTSCMPMHNHVPAANTLVEEILHLPVLKASPLVSNRNHGGSRQVLHHCPSVHRTASSGATE